jgi:hypothetical protein
MGALGFSMQVSGDGDIEELQDDVLEHVLGWLERSFGDGPYRHHREYLRSARSDRKWSEAGDTALHWMFPDFGGGCTRSKYLWNHWMRLGIAAQWDQVAAIADRHGYELGERWSIEDAHTDSFLELRDELWMIMEDALHRDGGAIGVEDLSPEEQALVETARKVCACAPCRMLRNPPAAEPPRPAVVRAPVPVAVPVEAPASPVAPVPSEGELQPLLEHYARLDASAGIASLAALGREERTKAIHALAVLPRTPEETAWLLGRIQSALTTEDDDPACALAELAGRLPGHEAEMAPALASVLDRSFIRERMRLAAITGLVATAAVIKPIPPEVRARLARESERGGEGAALAHTLLRAWD